MSILNSLLRKRVPLNQKQLQTQVRLDNMIKAHDEQQFKLVKANKFISEYINENQKLINNLEEKLRSLNNG